MLIRLTDQALRRLQERAHARINVADEDVRECARGMFLRLGAEIRRRERADGRRVIADAVQRQGEACQDVAPTQPAARAATPA